MTNRAWLADVLAGERQAWVFVFKCVLAFYGAAGIAMLLELPQPSTAMVTVGLVMHPQAGMVRAKGFYRALGNAAGCVCGVLLIALFPQQPELFLPCLCLWVALCAGGAMKYRNFMAYGFVLSGYTTAIVTLPSIADPLGVFDSAVMRLSEVLVGVVVSGLVSELVLPDRLGEVLRRSRREHVEQFITLAAQGLDASHSPQDREKANLRFVRSAVQIEDLRASVVFEEAGSRALSSRMQLHNLRYMAAATTFQSLFHLVARLRRSGRPGIADGLVQLYSPIAGALAVSTPTDATLDVMVSDLASCETDLPALATRLRSTHAADKVSQLEFDGGAALVMRFASEMRDLTALEVSLRKPRERLQGRPETLRFKRSNDHVAPLLTVVRSFFTLGLLCLFWIHSSWPSALSAVLTASYFLGLFAGSPSPVSTSVNLSVGYALGMVAAFITEFYFMPDGEGFTMLVLSTLPFMLIGPYLLTRGETLPGMGIGYILAFVSLLALKNPMVYDPVHFINDGLASFVGVVACAASFHVVPTVIGTAWLRARQLRKLNGQVAFAAFAPMRGLLYHAESANRDLLHQIVQFTRAGTPELTDLLGQGLALHERVRAIIELRQDAEHPALPPPLKEAIQMAIEAVARMHTGDSRRNCVEAERYIASAVTLLSQAQPQAGDCCRPPLAHLLQLRIALVAPSEGVGARRV